MNNIIIVGCILAYSSVFLLGADRGVVGDNTVLILHLCSVIEIVGGSKERRKWGGKEGVKEEKAEREEEKGEGKEEEENEETEVEEMREEEEEEKEKRISWRREWGKKKTDRRKAEEKQK